MENNKLTCGDGKVWTPVLVNSSATVLILAIVWFVSIALMTPCKYCSVGLNLGLSGKLFRIFFLYVFTGLRLGVQE